MANNLQLTELEQRVLDYVKRMPCDEIDLLTAFYDYSAREVRQALSNLIALGFVSQDENLRYSAVGKELL